MVDLPPSLAVDPDAPRPLPTHTSDMADAARFDLDNRRNIFARRSRTFLRDLRTRLTPSRSLVALALVAMAMAMSVSTVIGVPITGTRFRGAELTLSVSMDDDACESVVIVVGAAEEEEEEEEDWATSVAVSEEDDLVDSSTDTPLCYRKRTRKKK